MSEFPFKAPIIPDTTEVYIGYKALDLNAVTGYLRSPSQPVEWPAGKRLQASCTGEAEWGWVPVEVDKQDELSSDVPMPGSWRAETPDSPVPSNPLPEGWQWRWHPIYHDAPAEGCTCGIYVKDKPQGAVSYLSPKGIIVEVALWGKVIRGDKGARGQYAYPQALLTPTQLKDEVEETAALYQVPIVELPEQQPGKPLLQPMIKLSTFPTAVLPTAVQGAIPGDLMRAILDSHASNPRRQYRFERDAQGHYQLVITDIRYG